MDQSWSACVGEELGRVCLPVAGESGRGIFGGARGVSAAGEQGGKWEQKEGTTP